MKHRVVRLVQRYLFNPVFRVVMLSISSRHALLETTGRRSGKPRRVPIGIDRHGQTVWFVSEHGPKSDYVRNIEADPRVRLRIRRRWHTGRAETVPADDPRARLASTTWFPGHAATVRLMGTDLLTLKITLDQA